MVRTLFILLILPLCLLAQDPRIRVLVDENGVPNDQPFMAQIEITVDHEAEVGLLHQHLFALYGRAQRPAADASDGAAHSLHHGAALAPPAGKHCLPAGVEGGAP